MVKIYWVNSGSVKNVKYAVRKVNGRWLCNCPHFLFNKVKDCKHIREVIKKEEKL